MIDPIKNFAITTVATAPSPANSGTSLVVAAGKGALFPTTADGDFNVVVFPADEQPDTVNAEIVRVTAVTTDTFTIVRQQESTAARTIVIGDIVMLAATKKTWSDLVAMFSIWKGAWVTSTAYVVNDIVRESNSVYICVTAHTSGTFLTDLSAGKWELFAEGKTMPTGDIVGTTDTQTLTNKTIQLTAAPASDHIASGTTILLTAAANVAFGDVCYIASTGKAALIDADAIATMTGVVMAVATISADASGLFMLQGIARDDTWAWTVGGLIYGSVTGTTGNTLTQTAPSGTDDVVQILGVATHADRMFFNPQLVQIERT